MNKIPRVNAVSDQMVYDKIVFPAGGIEKFRLVICPGFKLIQYSYEGKFLDLIIEEDDLADATIALLERSGVLEIPREAR